VHEITTFLLVTLPNTHPLIFFTLRLSNKPFLIWLLTTTPYLKYAATLPCNLSLRACFLTLMFSQGSAATYTMSGDVFNDLFTASLLRNLPVILFVNQLTFDKIVAITFLVHPVVYYTSVECNPLTPIFSGFIV